MCVCVCVCVCVCLLHEYEVLMILGAVFWIYTFVDLDSWSWKLHRRTFKWQQRSRTYKEWEEHVGDQGEHQRPADTTLLIWSHASQKVGSHGSNVVLPPWKNAGVAGLPQFWPKAQRAPQEKMKHIAIDSLYDGFRIGKIDETTTKQTRNSQTMPEYTIGLRPMGMSKDWY